MSKTLDAIRELDRLRDYARNHKGDKELALIVTSYLYGQGIKAKTMPRFKHEYDLYEYSENHLDSSFCWDEYWAFLSNGDRWRSCSFENLVSLIDDTYDFFEFASEIFGVNL